MDPRLPDIKWTLIPLGYMDTLHTCKGIELAPFKLFYCWVDEYKAMDGYKDRLKDWWMGTYWYTWMNDVWMNICKEPYIPILIECLMDEWMDEWMEGGINH